MINVSDNSQARPRLTSGFVFKSVFGNSPRLCKLLLEAALEVGIEAVEVVQPEREFDVAARSRAGRVDVYVVDSDGNRYDVEIQAESNDNEVLRARHYQSLMDVAQLRKGTGVEGLRGSVVLFVCDFDPLGAGLRRYDCRTTCLQTREVVPDGRRAVFLNSRGGGDDVGPELDAFLRLVRGEPVEGSPLADGINATIDTYIVDAEWMEQYMTFEDELDAAKKAAARAAAKERTVTLVCALMQSQGWGVEAAMDALDLAPEERAYVTKELQGKS